MSGGQPLGLGDATSAVADMADLADLESALGQEYAGANLEDVDEEAVRRALGRRRSTTCRRSAGSNASCSARATWPATAATWS